MARGNKRTVAPESAGGMAGGLSAKTAPRDQVALMFSGGVDSTVAAVRLLSDFDCVHLLTYSNGYGHYGFGRTRRRFRELKERFPGRFVHFEASIRPLFERICLGTIVEDYRRFGSAFMWCMGCKLAMHARSVIYCREQGILHMADGSAGDSDEMVEQMLLSVSMVHWLYADHGIDYFVPVYGIGRDEKRRQLREQGYFMGIPLLDRYLGIQPSCIPGELYYLPYILFNKAPGHDEETVARYISEKRPVVDEIIGQARISTNTPGNGGTQRTSADSPSTHEARRS